MTYPVSTSGYRFKLQYEHAYGQIAKVRRFDSPNTVYWKFNTLDARGNVDREELGNGVKITSEFNPLTGLLESRQSGVGRVAGIQELTYQWSNNGNLTQRRDVRQGLTEVFTYDSMERLDVTTLNSSPTLDVDYNSIGNITKKSDVSPSNWTYDGTRKHAVTAIGANTFAYDGNGNATTRDSSSISWYSYNLPNTIDGSGGVSSQFTYDPMRNRVKQVATYSAGTETTHYIGGLMEKVVTSSNTQYRHYIATPTGMAGLYTRRTSGTPEDTFYFTKDHLGSIDSITNASGAIQVRLSYDAFGKRRNEAGWSGTAPTADWTAIANTTRRGYTGHEHLDNLGLIHMNGRVQDPTIGRFLSADPFVPNPLSGQSFNRYSYVANNPLSLIDPSGFTDTQPDDPTNDPREGNPHIGFSMDMSWVEFRNADLRRQISRSNPYVGLAGGGGAVGAEYLEAQDAVSGIDGWAQGTRGDFGIGFLRRDLDDAFQHTMLLSAAVRMVTGDVLGARMFLQLSALQLFGPPDTNLGVLGYDLEPAAGVILGGVYGGVRTILGRIAARYAAGAGRAFWIGPVDGQAAAAASGAKVLKPSKAAVEAAARGDWSLMRAESAAFARGATGQVKVFWGDGKGRIFRSDELPELLKNLESGQVTMIEITF